MSDAGAGRGRWPRPQVTKDIYKNRDNPFNEQSAEIVSREALAEKDAEIARMRAALERAPNPNILLGPSLASALAVYGTWFFTVRHAALKGEDNA